LPVSEPDAKANEPGGTTLVRNWHGLGPLHISFCKVASNELLSALTVWVGTQPGCAGSTIWRTECVKLI
jgi:hypothetical protein